MRQVRKRIDSLSLWFVVGVLLVLVVAFLAGVKIRDRILHDPRVLFLSPEKEAKWIRVGRPSSLKAFGPTSIIHEFRKRFEVGELRAEPVLKFRALQQAVVTLDGQIVYAPRPDQSWKETRTVSLHGRLAPGPHELVIAVRSISGALALLAWCETINLYTGDDWEARDAFSDDIRRKLKPNVPWEQASWVQTIHPTVLSRRFPKTVDAFVTCLPFILPLFCLVASCVMARERFLERYSGLRRFAFSTSGLRWALLGACAVLWLNNVPKLPLSAGFDINAHLEYIRYVAETRSIPDARHGLQTFQSPLYYMVSAVFVMAFGNLAAEETLSYLLRLIPVLCGLVQIEVCYRAVRIAFPGSDGAQKLGLLVGGLLPMNLYLSNYVGNEPMAGCLSAAAGVIALACVTRTSVATSNKWQLLLGLFLGLALLTKVTAILLVPPLTFALIWGLLSARALPGRIIKAAAQMLAVTAVVCGWYYLYNWVQLGKPFIGGWDTSRGIVWWQDPGYRTLQDFVSFSEALSRPINAAIHGFWDGLYSTIWLDGHLSSVGDYDTRPPWNYAPMLAAPWLAVVPTLAILAGVAACVYHPERATRQCLVLSAMCVAVYISAMLYLFLHVASFSTVKATYSWGILPCYAVLAGAGLTSLSRYRLLRALVIAAVICYAVFAYAAYFVI